MSTYVYLECLSHTPPIRANDESGQHLYDLRQVRLDLLAKEELVEVIEDGWEHPDRYRMNTAWFVAKHLECELGIVDEYGDRHSTKHVHDCHPCFNARHNGIGSHADCTEIVDGHGVENADDDVEQECPCKAVGHR